MLTGEVLSSMTRRLFPATLTLLTLVVPAWSGEPTRGGAIPQGLSYYQATEFNDVQWLIKDESGKEQPVWGTLVFEGEGGIKFTPEEEAPKFATERKIAYDWITGIKFEKQVTKKPKAASPKWYNKPFAFARGTNTAYLITLQVSDAKATLQVDADNYAGLVRMLEIKTGQRARRVGLGEDIYSGAR
jgi:hypothetical protein